MSVFLSVYLCDDVVIHAPPHDMPSTELFAGTPIDVIELVSILLYSRVYRKNNGRLITTAYRFLHIFILNEWILSSFSISPKTAYANSTQSSHLNGLHACTRRHIICVVYCNWSAENCITCFNQRICLRNSAADRLRAILIKYNGWLYMFACRENTKQTRCNIILCSQNAIEGGNMKWCERTADRMQRG